jgi:ubiquinone/menaquinone biosynthesis C-methylase UbiE
LRQGGKGLDCGAHEGQKYHFLRERAGIRPEDYLGIEWNQEVVLKAKQQKINVVQGDLNQKLTLADNEFKCVFGLSVIEHLLNPCLFLKEFHCVLERVGRLILLTPNIGTFFTALLILLGKMPSSGPHPDSDMLLAQQES